MTTFWISNSFVNGNFIAKKCFFFVIERNRKCGDYFLLDLLYRLSQNSGIVLYAFLKVITAK